MIKTDKANGTVHEKYISKLMLQIMNSMTKATKPTFLFSIYNLNS
jgi:hypothetical protein